jgi:hypothetical protein
MEKSRKRAETMSDQHLEVPDKCPDTIELKEGETLTIIFNHTAYFWNTEPLEFDPPLAIDIYKKGERWVGVAKEAKDVRYGWLTLLLEDERDCRPPIRAAGHTITVGSGGGG